MGGVDLLGFLLVTLDCNVTMLGKIWLLLTVLLRLALLVLGALPVYQDEQERFTCNTLQPGCVSVCYDAFSPVSPVRFWVLHSVSVILPYAVFSAHVLHAGARLAARRLAGECRLLRVPDFSGGYVLHLCLRTLLEAALGASHYLLFGFLGPARFSCSHAPCPGVVDCYVSRPTEKSLVTLIMWAASALSLLLGVLDLVLSLRARARRKTRLVAKSSSIREQHAGGPEDEEGGQWADGVSTCPGPWSQGEDAASPGGTSHESRCRELPDEDASEGMSLASDHLARGSREPGGRPLREAFRHPSSSGSTGVEERSSLDPRVKLAAHHSCSQLQAPARPASSGSAPHLRAKRSEWV
ncbi:gap junction delta-4 protein [Ochotona princeps]|uniref:gap junction delta-4 protein n=1 Tax=Ochotona princeps TaxID=9978 RepID=UPI002714B3FC|nr:gap junction delta-4 protein [Ochotona princeps]